MLSGPSSLRQHKSLDGLSSLVRSKPDSPHQQSSLKEGGPDSNISDMLSKLIREQETQEAQISEEDD